MEEFRSRLPLWVDSATVGAVGVGLPSRVCHTRTGFVPSAFCHAVTCRRGPDAAPGSAAPRLHCVREEFCSSAWSQVFFTAAQTDQALIARPSPATG